MRRIAGVALLVMACGGEGPNVGDCRSPAAPTSGFNTMPRGWQMLDCWDGSAWVPTPVPQPTTSTLG